MRLIDADKIPSEIVGYEFIKRMPTEDAILVKHGKWIVNKWGALVCSECNWCAPVIETGSLVSRRYEYDKSKYCWNCGAKMDGEEE